MAGGTLTQVEHFRQQAALTACSVPVLWQQTLADFMQDGHFWRHLKRMRQNYALRRQWMENALSEQGFNVIPQEGGIQLVITVDGDDVALVRKANQAGLAVQALSRWRITSAGKGEYCCRLLTSVRWKWRSRQRINCGCR